MKYEVFSQNEWLFPDLHDRTGMDHVEMTLLRKQTGGVQMQITELPVGETIRWYTESLEGIHVRFYRALEVCVNRNTNNPQCGELTTDDWDEIAEIRVRRAPYRTYDPLLPADGLTVEKTKEVFFAAFVPNESAEAGRKEGHLCLDCGGKRLRIPVFLTVHGAVLPERTLHLTNWLGVRAIAEKHHLEYGSPVHFDMVKKYIDTMRDCHQNLFWVTFDDVRAKRVDGRVVFDFSDVKRWAELALECGIETLEWAHIISRPSWQDPPFMIADKSRDDRMLECLSTEGRKYMTAFLTQFNDFLTENGWREISLVHISDEPKERCAADFRILAGIYRKYLPGIRLIDAVEIYFVEDALDIYVPKNHYYQQNRNDFENLRDERNELWFYTCNMPGGKFLNRFLDSPLLHTRLLHWGNYRYRLTGYLHWGYFHVLWNQDPFEETSGTTGLPAGDTHIVYPGEDGPLLSLRWYAMKCGTEDYEILRAYGLREPEKANGICRRVLRAFDDYLTDTEAFEQIRTELVNAYAGE